MNFLIYVSYSVINVLKSCNILLLNTLRSENIIDQNKLYIQKHFIEKNVILVHKSLFCDVLLGHHQAT